MFGLITKRKHNKIVAQYEAVIEEFRACPAVQEAQGIISMKGEYDNGTRPIPGYEKYYTINTKGEVWSIRWSKYLKTCKPSPVTPALGIKLVNKDGKQTTFGLAKLVYCVFNNIPVGNFTPKIRYRDGNPENVELKNLYINAN